jgi:hypothetical protein
VEKAKGIGKRAGIQEDRSSGVQEFRSSGVQEFRSSGGQEDRRTGVSGSVAFLCVGPLK